MSKPCRGLLGWLFGHKFCKTFFWAEYQSESPFCYRCGMPKGGWR